MQSEYKYVLERCKRKYKVTGVLFADGSDQMPQPQMQAAHFE